MEQEKKVYTVLAIVVVAALLLSCLAGAVAGTATGYLVARRQARLEVERALAGEFGEPPDFHGFPEFEQEEIPFHLPEPDEDEPFPLWELPPGLQGAFIRDVVPGAPADEAGLGVGDVIVAVDRTPIDARHPLAAVIGQYRPGDRITIRYWRVGEEGSVRVKLAEHPEAPRKAYLGVFFDAMDWPGFDLPHD